VPFCRQTPLTLKHPKVWASISRSGGAGETREQGDACDRPENRLSRLIVLRDELQRMVHACKNGCVADCQVIEALARTS
jgi:hypothetical protein